VTDAALVAKKLARIETCVHELRTLARAEAITADIKEARFVQHTLQIALQAVLDVCSHVVSDERLGEPRSNRELTTLLHRAGWIASPTLADTLSRMIAFRNILVHDYDTVNLDIVRTLVDRHLDDLLAFVSAIRPRVRED
jgi:uncharacterized protein YutE (UPF0331/DUF86 family)